MSAFRDSSLTGVYSGPDCPECRSKEVKKGRVRIWALEEAIRIVAKGVEQSAVQFVPPPPEHEEPVKLAPATEPTREEMETEMSPEEEDAARLLRPRQSFPYSSQS